ncbi:hypothetical protein CHELA20_53753 [Hyphomicrobiales bacterium]|nr:hypothetical protein CHELA41_21173 [Hyphomicrobiales bacterium]CAH1684880.1 hypothetical protein CHELA20_53753 [Hyphomicrobiales bacterium]
MPWAGSQVLPGHLVGALRLPSLQVSIAQKATYRPQVSYSIVLIFESFVFVYVFYYIDI